MNTSPSPAPLRPDSAPSFRPTGWVLLPVLVAVLVCLGASTLSPSKASVANTVRVESNQPHRDAACLLMIHLPSGSHWTDFSTLSALLQTSGVADAPAREILGMEPDMRQQKVRFQIGGGTQPEVLSLHLRVILDLPQQEGVPDLAGPYLAAVVERFKAALSGMAEKQVSRLKGDLRFVAGEIERTGKELDGVREGLGALDKEVGMIAPMSMDLRAEPARLRGEIAGAVMNLDGYRRVAAETRGEAEPDRSHLAAEWQRVVILREEKLEEIRRLAAEGKVDPVDLAEFEARLAEARAQVASPQQGQALMSGILGRPRRNPADLDQLIAGKEADLAALRDRLSRLEKLDVRRLAGEMEGLEKEERRLLDRLDALKKQREELEQDLQAMPRLSVEVIGE